MNPLLRAIQRFTGRGEAAITMPPMDGALRPNQILEEAHVARDAAAPDDLVMSGGEVLVSSGRDLVSVASGKVVRSFDHPITALAADAKGRIAVGLSGAGVAIHDGGETLRAIGGSQVKNVTALAFVGEDLVVCEGSAAHAPEAWKHDLMDLGFDGTGSGSVWRFGSDGAGRQLAGRMRYPNGVLEDGTGRLVVSEAWNHRLVRVEEGSKPQVLVGDLTGYPARMARAAEGGIWLALFAPRSQLIEFVLREPKYRKRMTAGMAPDYWIAPALTNGRSFLEPLQGGAVKQMGVLKPWAPTRSYGLVVLLDDAFEPVLSLHSRADGTRHGTTSVLEKDGVLYVASKGGNVVVSVPTGELSET